MTPPTHRLVLLTLPLSSIWACADTAGCDEPLRICDIGSADCREHVFVQTACARGFDGRTPPPVDSITREEFIAYLQSGDAPTEQEILEDAQRATTMRMLRLLPPGTAGDSAAAIQARAESVLAFYSPDTERVTLIETNLGDAERSTEVFVLSHEFVHAQADIDVDLAAFIDAHATSLDSSIAARAVGEGDAMHYSNLTMARQNDDVEPTLAGFLGYYAELQGYARESAVDPEAGYQALASEFPYPFGGQVVTETWFSGGDAAVLELYDDPWASTADVLRLTRSLPPRGTPDLPGIVEPALPEGWTALADDTLGAWITFAFAARHQVGAIEALELADDWSGDRIVAVGGSTPSEVAFVWRVRFGSEASAEAFAVARGVPPTEGAFSFTQDGAEVTIVAAPDSASLPEWTSTFEASFVDAPLSLRTAAHSRVAPPLRVPEWPPSPGSSALR